MTCAKRTTFNQSIDLFIGHTQLRVGREGEWGDTDLHSVVMSLVRMCYARTDKSSCHMHNLSLHYAPSPPNPLGTLHTDIELEEKTIPRGVAPPAYQTFAVMSFEYGLLLSSW